jgi:hypothetical protein
MDLDQPGHGLWTETVPPSPYFESEFRGRMIENFGQDGAWLLLSIIHYGWRANYDLACSLATGPLPTDAQFATFAADFEVVRHLQLQGHLYAAVEQLATLIRAARSHLHGGQAGEERTPFFEAYVNAPMIGQGVRAFASISRDDLKDLLAFDDLDEQLTRMSRDWPGDGIQPPSEYVTVGGTQVPRIQMSSQVISSMRDEITRTVEETFANLTEFQKLIEPPDEVPGAPAAQSRRELDNSFRHGLRVMFNSANPSERTFRFAGERVRASSASVYLPPRGKERIEFGDIDATPEATEWMIRFLRLVSLRIGMISLAFAGRVCFNDAYYLIAGVGRRLGDDFPGVRPIAVDE